MIRIVLSFLILSAGTCLANRVANKITPQVVERGREVKVLLEGNNLENVQGILAYSEGIRFVRVEEAKEVDPITMSKPEPAKPGQAVILVLDIAKDCAVGEHLFRVRTKETLSEFQTIWISPFPCIREEFPYRGDAKAYAEANTIEKAQAVNLNTTVWGHLPGYSNFDQDFFKLELKAGQRLTAEVWGSCFSNPIDASLTLYGPDKEQILQVDDTILRERDPFFSYLAKEDGLHYVAIHPFNDDENGLWHYALHFSGAKRPTVAYPMGGRAGTTLKTTLMGDPKGDDAAEIKLPSKPGPFEKSIFDYRPDGAVIPVHFNVADFDNVMESKGDHGSEETAQLYKGKLPVAFNGRITSEGEIDWFRFSAKKGERYLVRTYAGTFGSPLDPSIIIKAAEGTESRLEIAADDSSWHDHDWCNHGKWRCKDLADPIVVFEADADGDYLLGIFDNQRLFSPEHIYRVEFQPARDRMWLQNTHDYRESIEKRDAIVIHAGNSIERTYSLIVPPITSYRGEFDIVIEGLPAGVTYRAPRVDRNSRIVQLIFSAAKGTKPWAGFPEIEFRPVEEGVKLGGGYRYVHSRTIGRGGLTSGFYRRTGRFALSVVEEAPLSVTVEKPSMGLALNAFVDLKVKVDRSHGFDGSVVIRALWTPPHVTAAPPLTIPAGESSAIYRLTAANRAKPGEFPLTLTAHEAEGESIASGLGYHFVSSPPIDVVIVEPYLKITLNRSAIERGKEGEITGTIEHIRPVPEGTTATLSNLPTGVELLKKVSITPGTKEVSFPIRATSAALLGQAKDIACHVTISEGAQSIVQSTGVATLRIDAERR